MNNSECNVLLVNLIKSNDELSFSDLGGGLVRLYDNTLLKERSLAALWDWSPRLHCLHNGKFCLSLPWRQVSVAPSVMLTDQRGFGEVESIESVLEVPENVAGIANGLIRHPSEPGVIDRVVPPLQKLVPQRCAWLSIQYLNLDESILSSSARK